jgi:hypothetical protein
MRRTKIMIWARVDTEVRDLVEKLAKAKGISISEYVRSLILEDLDKRTIFTMALKQTLHEPQREEAKG